ncbi:cyclopropane fatty-acyl-phospholipid synthase-like methyltransferase [Novosphingobium capsulatum]|uniref:Cyclopropane fatty-acyl-phospholipid synthase-like methyltransferase n=1 Tax=Novosphingobium capsulatum TaxID=13688 RepID=A0ABU1MNM6_9SPHN|nr:class I SAM-dependent methyltransferase [Novosphingobium capsulatum]MDR6511943.1 cyclopropane fatty-acyl-phospholipid synthase-like methyltransferase [Novosphingobium capsulatum]
MTTDHSAGWEAVSDQFMAIRSEVGTALVRNWAKDRLPQSSAILDIGCGSGVPIARALVNDGFSVWGVDASPSLVLAYRINFPAMPAICEPAQDSSFFDRTFVGVVSIGLIFLLGEGDQTKLLTRVADVLEPGGRFLFSAPREACHWNDTLTGRASLSLGADAYASHLTSVGLRLDDCRSDEGGNDYYEAVRPI